MGLNKIFLQGNLVKDPEARTTVNGVNVTTFKIAVGRRFAKPEDEVRADFFDCVAWRGLADFVANNFVKGKPILVVGTLQNRSFTTQDGQKRYITEVVVDECQFCGNKENSAENNKENNFTPNFEELGEDEDLPF